MTCIYTRNIYILKNIYTYVWIHLILPVVHCYDLEYLQACAIYVHSIVDRDIMTPSIWILVSNC